ncbi:hypothetical protein skT53_07290 [Effusibacillus dendaii]|uniref:Uncharacterized protein n=2 Tax=Effusibacillus dendaii TaxID=2743772 RepID=A0A7I8D6K1_9BACL|nr:hypothetical protein skT53_07290 [Effusibacillus dendaii]
MLICYPEVSSVRYNPLDKSFVFSFFRVSAIDDQKKSACLQDIKAYFAACRELDPSFPPIGEIEFNVQDGITVLSYRQSSENFSRSEIHLLVSVIQSYFANDVKEDFMLLEQELKDQEATIDMLLGHRHTWFEQEQIIAYRDGAKVFIYNR